LQSTVLSVGKVDHMEVIRQMQVRCKCRCRHAGMWTGRRAGRQKHRQTTDRQASRQTGRRAAGGRSRAGRGGAGQGRAGQGRAGQGRAGQAHGQLKDLTKIHRWMCTEVEDRG
jgi:hypothetical protein